jgi:DUF1365 family protein
MSAAARRLSAAIGAGAVMHERHMPWMHRFTYPVRFLRVPLSCWGELRVSGLGIDRPALLSLRSRDHGPRDGSALLPWIRGLLAERGLASVCDGEVVLQTCPRVFGFVFNPVSFWLCHDREGRLRAVLAEVNNTFGEGHNYWVAREDVGPIGADDDLPADKVFQVSPFFPVSGEYRFRFDQRDGLSVVCIDYWDGGALQLATRIGGRLEPLDATGVRHWLIGFPLLTIGIVWRIHWQALRLWLKGATFFRKPPAPSEHTT